MSLISSFIDWMSIINGLRIPVGNLGLSRSSMPQIDDDKVDDFKEYLANAGVDVTTPQIRIKDLRLTQNEVNKMKIWSLMKRYRQKKTVQRVWVSSDNYVVDGSHRFIAALNLDDKQRLKVYQANMPALELVKMANRFKGVRHRTVSDAR